MKNYNDINKLISFFYKNNFKNHYFEIKKLTLLLKISNNHLFYKNLK